LGIEDNTNVIYVEVRATVKLISNLRNLDEHTLQNFIKLACALSFFSFFLPWLLVVVDANSPWAEISGLGFGQGVNFRVFSPSIFLFTMFYVICLFNIIKDLREPAKWNHLKPSSIMLFMFVFELISKRQQIVWILSDRFHYRAAQCDLFNSAIAHAGPGLMLFFFTSILLNGLLVARAELQQAQWVEEKSELSRYIGYAILLYLTPLFFSYDPQNGLSILFGFGYGFLWNSEGFFHGTSLSGCLLNLLITFLLALLFAYHKYPKAKVKVGMTLLAINTLIFSSLGYMYWSIYVPGGEYNTIFPPMSFFLLALFYCFAHITWDIFVTLSRIVMTDSKVSLQRELDFSGEKEESRESFEVEMGSIREKNMNN
jgi:hypothetical protein